MKDGKDEKKEIEQKAENPGQNNLRSLTFIVNGKEITIEKVNLNQPLSVAVEKALEKAGVVGRTADEYLVTLNDNPLNVAGKVESFKFSADVKILITLKSGVGG